MGGLLSYGVYVPYRRLSKATIGSALGTGSPPGSRAVASYDEDTTTMGVEAARVALRGAAGTEPAQLLFATSAPAYLDKANAAVIHAALGLDPAAFAADVTGSLRSGLAAIRAAASAGEPTLVVLADTRTGRPGSADERDGGDAAAALLFGDGPVLLDTLAATSATAEFLDRWRRPGDTHSQVWEERFGEQA
jgi:hydroxymethylglutaryl-CoA synthase